MIEARQWTGAIHEENGADYMWDWTGGDIGCEMSQVDMVAELHHMTKPMQRIRANDYVVKFIGEDGLVWHELWKMDLWEHWERTLAPWAVDPWFLPRLPVFYKNHAGDVRGRMISPLRSWHGATQWHPKEQYLLDVWDHEKRSARTFALVDCDFRSLGG